MRYIASFHRPNELWNQVVIVDNHWACIGGLDLCFGSGFCHGLFMTSLFNRSLGYPCTVRGIIFTVVEAR